MKLFTVEEITSLVSGEQIGNCKDKIYAPEQIENAVIGNVTFIGNSKYAHLWEASNASVAIVYDGIKISPEEGNAFIKVKNPDLAMAILLDAFEPESPYFHTDIHPTAVIDKTATLGKGCKIGANSFVGKNVQLGENVIIYPNVSIFDDSTIGSETVIWSGTVIRERSEIGSRCIFHSNVSIGADGFGYRPSNDGRGLVKIKHIGNVVIGNDVEVGANSCIDRGKFSATILGDGVVIGGSASIKDHVTIQSGAKVGAGSGVINNVEAGKTVIGYPASDSREKMKEWVAVRKLARS
jgi:UDP-3-O-[3-hydroxymyristoyl] glucosamine N-acyltransferase